MYQIASNTDNSQEKCRERTRRDWRLMARYTMSRCWPTTNQCTYQRIHMQARRWPLASPVNAAGCLPPRLNQQEIPSFMIIHFFYHKYMHVLNLSNLTRNHSLRSFTLFYFPCDSFSVTFSLAIPYSQIQEVWITVHQCIISTSKRNYVFFIDIIVKQIRLVTPNTPLSPIIFLSLTNSSRLIQNRWQQWIHLE